jgi:hypothetical protein
MDMPKILGELPEWPEFKWDPKALEDAYNARNGLYEEYEEELYQEPEKPSTRKGGHTSFKEIAAFFDICESNAHKIYSNAIRKLRLVCPEYGLTKEVLEDSPECHYDGANQVTKFLDQG